MSGLSGLLPDIGKLVDRLGLPDPLGLGNHGAENGLDGADGPTGARGPEGSLQHEGQGHHGGPEGHDPPGNAYGNRDPGTSRSHAPPANGSAQGHDGTQSAAQGQQPAFNPSSSRTAGSLQLPHLPGPPAPIVSIVQAVVALPGALVNGLFQVQPQSYASQGSQDFARYSNNNVPSNTPGALPSVPSPGNAAYGHAQANEPLARTDGGLAPNAVITVREVLTTILAPAAANAATTAQTAAAAAQASTLASNPVPLSATIPLPVPMASNPAATLAGAPALATGPTGALAATSSPGGLTAQTVPVAPMTTTASMSAPLANAVAAQQLVAPQQTVLAMPVRAEGMQLPGQSLASMSPPGQTAPATLGALGVTTAQTPTMAAIGNTAAVPMSQQSTVDARGVPLAAADRAQQNARADMVIIAGHTGETRKRSLRQRMMGTLTAPKTQLLATLAGKEFPRTRRHLEERQQAAQDLERAMQWVFWVLATAAYGCLVLALAIFATGSQHLAFQIPEMRSYTTGFALVGLFAGACAWLLARRLAK